MSPVCSFSKKSRIEGVALGDAKMFPFLLRRLLMENTFIELAFLLMSK